MNKFSRDFIGFYLFAFSLPLPLPMIYSAVTLAVAVLSGILLTRKLENKYPMWVYIFISFFLIDIFRSFLLESFSLRGFDETKLSFLVIPVLFYNIREKLLSQRLQIFFFFSVGVIFYVFYAIGYMIFFYNTYLNYTFSFTDHYIVYMLYNYLPGAYHHTYIGIYTVFAVVFLIFLLSKLRSAPQKIIAFIFLMLLFSFQVYIGSKMTMIISVIAVAYYFTYLIKSRKKLISIYLVLFSFAGLLTYVIKDWLMISINSIWYRVEYLKETVRLISDNYWVGVGSHNIKHNKLMIQGELKSLVPHNQYLHDFLSNGVLGFLLTISLFYILFRVAIKKRDQLFCTFIIMCFLLGFTEDFLHLQRGVFFFVFFSSLFVVTTSVNHENRN